MTTTPGCWRLATEGSPSKHRRPRRTRTRSRRSTGIAGSRFYFADAANEGAARRVRDIVRERFPDAPRGDDEFDGRRRIVGRQIGFGLSGKSPSPAALITVFADPVSAEFSHRTGS